MDMVDPELKAFVESEIIPQYRNFGHSHGVEHVTRVIANSMELARFLMPSQALDINMVYAIAAYHDLGMSGPREIHHITSGRILIEDARLRRWFTEEKMQIMKEAIEDHRASSDHEPRSIYGRIVAEADRDLDPQTVFTRAIEFGLEHYPEYDKEGQWQRFLEHMDEKYSSHGYLKLWISGSPNEMKLRQIWSTIDDRVKLRSIFDAIYSRLRGSKDSR
jgi:uncharacterized protein